MHEALGAVYGELLSGHNLLVYLAFLAVPAVGWMLYRTRFGLRLRAAGENPHSVDAAGVPVPGLRYRALVCTGVLCGVAGTYLSLAQSAGFINDMTAGKGYIALAALIFGKWRPVPAMLACLKRQQGLADRLGGGFKPSTFGRQQNRRSRTSSSGVRPVRTNSTIRCRKAGGACPRGNGGRSRSWRGGYLLPKGSGVHQIGSTPVS